MWLGAMRPGLEETLYLGSGGHRSSSDPEDQPQEQEQRQRAQGLIDEPPACQTRRQADGVHQTQAGELQNTGMFLLWICHRRISGG